MSKLRIVHYINQFFANINGGEKADYQPELGEGIVGSGMAFNQTFEDEAEIVAIVTCGDSYFNENVGAAKKTILDMVGSQKPDTVICGPAPNVGRYGAAYGIVVLVVKEELDIPVLIGMYRENPGVDIHKAKVYTVETRDSTAGTRSAVATMALLTIRLVKGERPGFPKEEGYMPSGVRVNFFEGKRGSRRAVETLVKKLSGKEFITEFPMSGFDRIDSSPAVGNMTRAKVVLVTSDGVISKGNPDHIESFSASKYGKYDIDGVMDLTEATYETAHGGYDPVYISKDADRIPPVDVSREFEKGGRIGNLHRYFCTTVGNGTSIANAKRFAAEFTQGLRNDEIDAVILTSTWSTCMRYGVTMVREIERAGIPVVHIATVVPVSLTVGANRIVLAIAISHPLGNPALTMEGKREIRRHTLTKVLTALETLATEQTVSEQTESSAPVKKNVARLLQWC